MQNSWHRFPETGYRVYGLKCVDLSNDTIKILEVHFSCNKQVQMQNNFLITIKKITHMWRTWSTPQNFCLEFIDELEKQLFIKKNVKWASKKCKNFNVYNVVYFLKRKEKQLKISLFQIYVPKILMIWSTVLKI